ERLALRGQRPRKFDIRETARQGLKCDDAFPPRERLSRTGVDATTKSEMQSGAIVPVRIEFSVAIIFLIMIGGSKAQHQLRAFWHDNFTELVIGECNAE